MTYRSGLPDTVPTGTGNKSTEEGGGVSVPDGSQNPRPPPQSVFMEFLAAVDHPSGGEPDEPCAVDESYPGVRPTIIFRRPEHLRPDSHYRDQRVRRAPQHMGVSGEGKGENPSDSVAAAPLRYYINSRVTGNWIKTLPVSNLVQLLLRDHGFDCEGAADGPWQLFWCDRQIELGTFELLADPLRRINQLPKATALTSKTALWTNFLHMQRRHGREAYDFVPDSFVLPAQLDEFEGCMRARLAAAQEADDDVAAASNIWVLKPEDGTKGRGIFLHRPEFDFTRGRHEVVSDAVRQFEGIACAYIDPPLLLNGGLKSDIRLYVLVTSTHPLVCYVHEQGLARFATEPYSIDELHDRCAHPLLASAHQYSRSMTR